MVFIVLFVMKLRAYVKIKACDFLSAREVDLGNGGHYAKIISKLTRFSTLVR